MKFLVALILFGIFVYFGWVFLRDRDFQTDPQERAEFLEDRIFEIETRVGGN